MRKTILSLTVVICSLLMPQNVLADWNTDIAKNNQVTPTDVSMYDPQMLTTSDGYTYCYFIVPSSNLNYRVQIMDPNGNRVCKTAGLTVSKEISNTWTKVNYPTTLDNEGNLIMAVQDMRTRDDANDQFYLYTLYKVNKKGEIVWAHSLNDSISSYDNSHITLSVAKDNSIYAAFGEASLGYKTRYLHIEKLDQDGKSLWEKPLIIGGADAGNYYYPTIKALPDNDALIGFLNTEDYHYQVIRINADGTQNWDSPKDIYTGSYGSEKIWDCMEMRQLNDSTFAFETLTGDKTTVVTCFDNDGNNLTFGAEAKEICNVTEDGISLDDFDYDAKANVLNFVYRQIDLDSSSHHGLYVQQMGVDGSWYFEDEGHPVIAMQDIDQYAYSQVRTTDKEDEMAVFYIKKDGHSYTSSAQCYMCKINYDTEMTLEPVVFTASESSKSDLYVSNLIDGQYYLASWLEKRGSASAQSIYMQRIYVDGDVECGIHDIQARPSSESSRMYDIMGREIKGNPTGMYICNGHIFYKK